MNNKRWLLVVIILIFFTACIYQKNQTSSPVEVVPFVDLNRYTGVWYEISRYPNRFQEGCVGTRATYTLRKDGRIDVLNECFEGSFSGKLRRAKGVAKVVDEVSKAKLKVTFFWPFYGDYWIIDLGEDYEYAVVGHPKKKYFWILSRTKKMDDKLYRTIIERLEIKGYEPKKLIMTPQE